MPSDIAAVSAELEGYRRNQERLAKALAELTEPPLEGATGFILEAIERVRNAKERMDRHVAKGESLLASLRVSAPSVKVIDEGAPDASRAIAEGDQRQRS